MASFIVYNNKAEKIDSNSMENLLYMSSIIYINLVNNLEFNQDLGYKLKQLKFEKNFNDFISQDFIGLPFDSIIEPYDQVVEIFKDEIDYSMKFYEKDNDFVFYLNLGYIANLCKENDSFKLAVIFDLLHNFNDSYIHYLNIENLELLDNYENLSSTEIDRFNIFKDLFSKIEINNIIYNNVNNDNYLDNYLLEI